MTPPRAAFFNGIPSSMPSSRDRIVWPVDAVLKVAVSPEQFAEMMRAMCAGLDALFERKRAALRGDA